MAVEFSGCVQKQTEAAFDGTSSSYRDIQENRFPISHENRHISLTCYLACLVGCSMCWFLQSLAKCSGGLAARNPVVTQKLWLEDRTNYEPVNKVAGTYNMKFSRHHSLLISIIRKQSSTFQPEQLQKFALNFVFF